MNDSIAETHQDDVPTRAEALFDQAQSDLHRRIDRMFCYLLVVQWLGGIAAALWISPRTWIGASSYTHWHVWAAIFFGGALAGFPILLARLFPGQALTRQAIAIAQTLTSALLIHLTGGRIETHFHVFGSLAFLAFYRDWRVLLTATLVVASDHLARGLFWPQSVFGVLAASQWRWLEHAGWVLFEDIFLYVSIRQGLLEMRETATRRAGLESLNEHFEMQVAERTRDLETANGSLKAAHLRSQELAETALEASRAKGDFLASMSHEIRTPMNGVIGMLGLLRETSLSDRQRQFVQIARGSAENLLTVINDILDFSKIEAGKLSIEPIPFDLQDAIEEASEIFAPGLAEKSLELIVQYSADAPRHVVGDPGRVRQVLTNLVSNAIKFTERGHVLLKLECECKSETEAVVKFSVEDTGIGIPPEKLRILFEKFTQADSSTTRRFGGTGLGLAISKQLTELMGGKVGVASEPGKGSTFWFTVPFGVANAPSETRSHAGLVGVRVLIVDDNEVNRQVLQGQIANWRMRPGVCASGAEALAALRQAVAAGDPYHLAVLDYQMPEMDGAMLARAAKADVSLRDTMLIILTSLGQPDDASELKQAGIFACLSKPARQSKLWDVLAEAWAARLKQSPAQMLTLPAALPSPAPARRARVVTPRTLVVDDGTTNQKVGRLMLENLGCHVDVAANGKEAVEMLDLLPYDAVFMDCEMPEMDGYEATAEIRRRQAGQPRVPIIAMTAKAINGDRERCLAAGMDDYISKPVRVEDLEAALERWVPDGDTQQVAKPGTASQVPGNGDGRCSNHNGAGAALDPAVTEQLRTLAQATNPALLNEIYESFVSSAVGYRDTVRQAAASGNAEEMAKAAHSLRGASANIGAKAMAELARALEGLGHSPSPTDAAELISQLEQELERVELEIQALIPTKVLA
ncbi:MAG TPA: response regulator [Candidatus Acidoferrum sp.]|jgi:two-component system sensor histidine kinase/response regulator|nr:response regulator [Candidatus Acidoferrum sp.]